MRQAPKNFILLVEMLERELPASVLLGSELASRGHHVWLIEKGRFRKSPASFAPSIVLEKGLTTGCLPKFRSIRGAGHVLTVMCQEGFTYRSGEDYIERRVFGETLKNVDYLFLWGERQKQDLQGFLESPRLPCHRQSALRSSSSPLRQILGSKEAGDLSRSMAISFFSPRALARPTISEETLDETLTGEWRCTRATPRRPPPSASVLRPLFEDYMNVVGRWRHASPIRSLLSAPTPSRTPTCGGSLPGRGECLGA